MDQVKFVEDSLLKIWSDMVCFNGGALDFALFFLKMFQLSC